ncbi:MAG TPA: sialidase family protein [Gemmataceae bacterium]|nr:sialidase family protein [Gemmataceae bacterium]
MSDHLLVSTKKGLFALDRTAAGWRVRRSAFLGENVTLAHADPRGGWYAALNLGHFGVKLKFSPDAGETWEDRAAPAYPEGETVATADGKPPAPAKLKLIWALESGGPDQSGRLWAGTLPGGLFRSDDGGQTWELVRSLWDRPERGQWFGGGADLPGIHSICRDPRDPRTLRIAVSCGGVWLTEDDGATWQLIGEGIFAEYMPPERKFDPNIQDVHQMAQCRSAPDCLWVQHHNGIFRSTDGGRHWEHVASAQPSGFGFGVVVHPGDPQTAWFVPAVKDERRVPVDGKLVVSRTRDGGKTFEVLRSGLPQEHCYDLVYRHALAVDDTGDRLAFGSTTGGLWISEDQGDQWSNITCTLPPIYAVRFA